MLRPTVCCDCESWNDAAHIHGSTDSPVPNCVQRHKSATGCARSGRLALLPGEFGGSVRLKRFAISGRPTNLLQTFLLKTFLLKTLARLDAFSLLTPVSI